MNRRLFSLFTLHTSLFVVLVLGCSSRSNDQREHLEFWALGSEGEFVQKMMPEFERRNPNIHVVIQQIPWNAAHEKLLTAYVGESTPDVSLMGNTWMPEFVAIGALDDLGALSTHQSDYFPGIWATNVVGRTLYGIPWYVDTRVLFYRSDILAAVGFPHGPRTWAEWREAMTRIRDQKKSKWGILIPTNEYEPMTVLAFSAHSPLLNADGTRGAFSQPQFADAFNFYVSLFHDGFAPKVSNAEIANLYQQFAQGEFTMYITGPWNVGEFRRRLPPEMQDKWATAPLPARDAGEPTGISMAGGGSLVVFRASKHKEAARKLIEFLSEPQQQVRFYELTGDLPARRSAWQSPVLATDTRFAAFRVQFERVAPLPKVPEWEQIASAIYDRGEAAARGTIGTKAALAQLDRRADELLEKRRWMLSRSRGLAVAQSRGSNSPKRCEEVADANGCHPEPPEARGREAAQMPKDGEGSQNAQLALKPRVSAGAAHLEILRRPSPPCASRRTAKPALSVVEGAAQDDKPFLPQRQNQLCETVRPRDRATASAAP